jgi:ABC-type antimicrobial peptide transport system permease subunit
MKAVGAGAGFLYRIVLAQAAMLTVGGFALGLVGALAVARLASEAVPEFATDFQTWDIAGVLTVAGIMALLASFVPVRRVNAIDPALVFRA